jgi:GNAT superfamily N-acetyltransferase
MSRRDWTIRRAGPDDLEAVVGLVGEFYVVDSHHFDRDRVVRALVPLLADDTYGVVWVIDADPPAGPQGYAVVTWGYAVESGGRDALLDELYVRDRGTGRGGALLEALLADCRDRGLPCVFLETEAGNPRVRSFYTRHGFAIEDSVWMSRAL